MKYVMGFVLGALFMGTLWYVSDSNLTAPKPEAAIVETGAAEARPAVEPTRVQSMAEVTDRSTVFEAPESPSVPQPPGMASQTLVDNRSEMPVLASQGHEKLLKGPENRPPSPRELHEQLQKEPVSPDWAPQMEAQLMEALLQHELISDFSIDVLVCRTTLCEIQALGIAGHESWGQILRDLGRNEWFRQFSSVSTSSSSTDTDATVLTLLQRKAGGS